VAEVRWERRGHVAWIVLDAPERRNAFTVEMADELVAVCDEIDRSEEVGAVVLSGAGGQFCAGADRNLLDAAGLDPNGATGYMQTGKVYDAVLRVGNLLPPTIAAVEGSAVGAGLNLMLATDLRIVAKHARILAGFMRIGIHPGGGHFSLMGRVTGNEAVAALSIFGEEIDGATAQRIGIAWEALAPDEVLSRATTVAA
jgi:enoyl-CoA hydratase